MILFRFTENVKKIRYDGDKSLFNYVFTATCRCCGCEIENVSSKYPFEAITTLITILQARQLPSNEPVKIEIDVRMSEEPL